jgi:hypothetical protein
MSLPAKAGLQPNSKYRVARRGRLLARRADLLKRGVGRLDLAAALRHKKPYLLLWQKEFSQRRRSQGTPPNRVKWLLRRRT